MTNLLFTRYIVEEDIRKVIIETSKSRNPQEGCLPFLLDMQVVTYENTINNNSPLEADNFAGNDEQAIEHFFEHIPKQTAYAIKVLSNLLFINETIINYLVRQQFFSAGVISMRELATFSFINSEAGQATIHGLMRDITSKQYQLDQPEEWLRLHEVMFNYYDNQIAFSEYKKISSLIGLNFEYASYYKFRYDFTNYGEWLVNRTEIIYGNDKLNSTTNILLSAINNTDIQTNNFLLGKLYYRLYEQYDSKLEERVKDYYLTLSSNCFREVLPISLDKETIDKLDLNEEQEDILYWLFVSLKAQANCLQEQDKLKESFDKWIIVLNLSNKYNFGYEVENYATLLYRLGYFNKSEPIIYNKYITANDIPSKAAYAHQLRGLYSRMGRYEEAITFFQIAYDYYSTVEDEPTWAGKMNLILADIFIDSGQKLVEAERLLVEAYDIFQLYLPEIHPDYSFYYTVLAKLYFTNKQFMRAVESAAEGFVLNQKIYTDLNEEFCEQFVIITNSFDMLLSNQEEGNQEKVFEDFSNAELEIMMFNSIKNISTAQNILGYHHPILHESIKWLIKHYEKLNQNENAIYNKNKLSEYQRILALNNQIRTSFFVENNITVEEQRINIINRCKTITSLPDDASDLKIAEYILPFFKTYRLYCIFFEGLKLPYNKYFLANDNKIFLLDTTNQSIYEVAKEELELNESNIVQWVIFFFDLVIGINGSFYLINDINEIPFKLDVIISKELKEKIINLVEPIKILTKNDNDFVLESKIVFQENMFY